MRYVFTSIKSGDPVKSVSEIPRPLTTAEPNKKFAQSLPQGITTFFFSLKYCVICRLHTHV